MVRRLSLLSPQSKFMELTRRKIILALYNFVCVCLRNHGELSVQLPYESKILRCFYRSVWKSYQKKTTPDLAFETPPAELSIPRRTETRYQSWVSA